MSSVKRTDRSPALCQSSVLTVRSRAIRGAANSKDAKDSHPENPFAYIPAVISPLGRTGCNVSDRRSITGVEREKKITSCWDFKSSAFLAKRMQ